MAPTGEIKVEKMTNFRFPRSSEQVREAIKTVDFNVLLGFMQGLFSSPVEILRTRFTAFPENNPQCFFCIIFHP